MSDGVTVIIMLSPAPGKKADIISKLKAYCSAIEGKEKGILAYHIADIVEKSDDGGEEIVTLTRYKDQATVDAHLASPAFADVKQVESMLRKPIVFKHMKDVAGFRAPGAN